jgi:crotonobetaine/carnitine-CoA ligase
MVTTRNITGSRAVDRDTCVVRALVDRHAARQPDRVFVRFLDGAEWTWQDLRRQVREVAAGLLRLGVKRGDRVVCWLPNGPEMLLQWFACNYLGAIHVPLNVAYRGRLLEHAISVAQARVGVVHASLADRLVGIDCGALEQLVVVGDGPWPTELAAIAWGGLPQPLEAANDAIFGPPVEPWDTMSIVFTSGTTGPSKGVLVPYFHQFCMADASVHYLGPQDRMLSFLPLFHAAAMGGVVKMLAEGGSIGMVTSFDTARFWQDARELGATTCVMLGSIAAFLIKQPPTDDERRTTIRTLLAAPLSPECRALAQRAGIAAYTCYNMTETSTPLNSDANPDKEGSCGRPRAGAECRVVDDNDMPLQPGAVGELVVRTDQPWAMNVGYEGDPTATAAAWRNGWFHTGDMFRVDGDGDYFFVDRKKDAIRRRGENISSAEVEAEIMAHDAVLDCAVVAVASEHGEDEVLACLHLRPGCTAEPEDIIAFLRPRMAHFMIPRYFRFLPQLPKTPTMKTQKHLLRAEGVTADTWDREAAGIQVRRDRIV